MLMITISVNLTELQAFLNRMKAVKRDATGHINAQRSITDQSMIMQAALLLFAVGYGTGDYYY